jgi:hypothetical protein
MGHPLVYHSPRPSKRAGITLSKLEVWLMRMAYCSKCTIGEDAGPSHAITSHPRWTRAVAGVAWLVLACFFLRIPVLAVAWPLTIVAAWFGVSHVVAGWIGYPDCPELGALASLISRRYIPTRCGPWARIDHWLEPRS